MAALALSIQGCSVPSYDSTALSVDATQKQAVIDQVNVYLSFNNCASAIDLISPLYNSAFTDNNVRMSIASAYGCAASINVFNIMNTLINSGSSLGGAAFWEFLVQQFPSTASPDDKIPQAAKNGTDAVFAAVKTGTIFLPSMQINSTTNNPGSLVVGDRTTDANTYLIYLSMALMGSLMSRDGAPTANHHKSVNLPWTTPATAVGNGCSFAAALLSYQDGLQNLSSNVPARAAGIYSSISSFLAQSLDTFCNLGCVSNGCTMGCSTCPSTLRNRDNCTGVTTDVNSCAAAGLATFVNGSWAGPP